MTQELKIKATLIDIEPKVDKNGNPFYKLSLQGCSNYFYAFSTDYHLKETATLTTLEEAPYKLVNCPVLITYQELPNQNNLGTFCKVKGIEIT